MNRRNFLGTVGTAGAAALVATVGTQAAAESMKSVADGTFQGRSNHVTTGSVSIYKEGEVYIVELGDDFVLDGGPDPRVGFGKAGEYLGAEGYLGALQSLNGKQRYAVPKVWDVSAYDEVFIWCDVAGVPLGVASLK
ncbi:MAG: DM13 domain-containing protein [Pelagimonas sp.]